MVCGTDGICSRFRCLGCVVALSLCVGTTCCEAVTSVIMVPTTSSGFAQSPNPKTIRCFLQLSHLSTDKFDTYGRHRGLLLKK